MPRFHENAVPRPLLGLIVALCVANATLSVWANLRLYRTSGNPGFLPAGQSLVVTVGQVRPDGPAVALRPGDEIVAIGGQGVRGLESVWRFFHGRGPGPYEITTRRDGRLLRETLEAPPYHWGWSLSFGLGRLAIHLLFALSGLALFLLRPESKAGLLLTLAFVLFVPGDMLTFSTDRMAPLARALYLLCDGLSLLFWPILLHFFLVFPEPPPVVRRRPILERLLYAPTLAAMLVAAPVLVLQFREPDIAQAALREIRWFPWLLGGVGLVSTVLGLLVLVTNYLRAGVAARRRLRVAVVGAVLGLLPLLVLLSTGAFFDVQRLPVEVMRAFGLLCILTLPLVPLSFGYAILKHEVIPVRVLLRRGLRYLLVSRGVVVVEALAVAALLAFALSGPRAVFVDALGPRTDIVVALLVGGLGMVGLHRLNRRLRTAVDRRFFREAYDARRVLTSLSEAVREVPSPEALVDLVANRVGDALHPECVRLYRRDEESGHFFLAHPRPPGDPERAPKGLVERLSGMDHAVAFDGNEPGPGGTVLAFAMRGRRELHGVLGLGPRKGDLPYTREDRELLRSVASQAGLSLENGGLIRRVGLQERVAHELTIAAEVQRRLFPDRAPVARGLDLAGVCVPAGDVGGDYYDFLELGDGRLGVAVADVAGKGLPAALLMSMIHASLRSQAANFRSLSETCDAMNRLLYRSTAPNAYATFFYGVFEEGSRCLRYVNAGHNPPLVVRAPRPGGGGADDQRGVAVVGPAVVGPALVGASLGATALARVAAASVGATALDRVAAASVGATDMVKLPATGLVLGALAESPYLEESVALEAGDVVVAYTDGVSEAFSPSGEEFGEERLFETVVAATGLPAAAIVERVTRAVEDWRGAEAAHDDFTLVVARVS